MLHSENEAAFSAIYTAIYVDVVEKFSLGSKVSTILGEHTMPHIGKRKVGVQILISAHINIELPYQSSIPL